VGPGHGGVAGKAVADAVAGGRQVWDAVRGVLGGRVGTSLM
jgi:hypothetical protein